MIDGAMMNIAARKNSEPLVSKKEPPMPLSKTENKSQDRQESLMSSRDDNKFERNLNRSMEKRDKKSQTPDKHEPPATKDKQASANTATKLPNSEQQGPVKQSAHSQNSAMPLNGQETNNLKPVITSDARQKLEAIQLAEGLDNWSLEKTEDPVLEFMDSMESEFGIVPDRLVAAFGHLSDSQLMQSPEKSMEAYLKQLDIPQGEMPKAQELYQKLLMDMRIQKIGKNDSTNLIPVELQSAMSEMQSLSQPIALGKDGIEGMNDKFFGVYPNQFGRPIKDGPLSPEQVLAQQVALKEQSAQSGQSNPLAATMGTEVIVESGAEDAPVDTADALWAQRINQQQAKQQEGDSSRFGIAGVGAVAGAAVSESTDVPDAEVPEWLSKLNQVNAEAEAEGKVDARSDHSSFNEEGGDSQTSKGGNTSIANPEGASKNNAENFAKVLATGTAAQASKAEGEAEGVDSIVKNVQLLKNRGGGEMKVQLNQEGLGDVQLKVAVNEGKVNIQMLTENKDAKKLIESDLGALKVELGDKKIDLTEIKVDVAKDLKNQLEQQLQDQKRDETRQFWEQFKQENDAKRAMAVNMGLNSYSRKDPNSLEDRAAEAGRYQSANLDSRLNIVA